MNETILNLSAIASLALLTHAGSAQVVINEIFENPPGRGVSETGWEFVEFYGHPGMSLDGCMLLVLKGGADDNRDGVPEVMPQIDEVFDLTGCTLSDQGLFTLVGNRGDGESPIADQNFEPNSNFDPGSPESPRNPRWIGALSFSATTHRGAPSSTRLDNHGSSTYSLVYIPLDDPDRGSMSRGVCHDTDFDGRFDPTLMVEGVSRRTPSIQVIDEVAWSNRAGQEYTIWDENELSETHGLNPDAMSRLAFYIENPHRGSRTKDRIKSGGEIAGFRVLSTTIADESFLAGVIDSERFSDELMYFDGFDIDGWPQLLGPTDRTRLPYGELSGNDPEPDTNPFPNPVPRDPYGGVYLDDIRPIGFALTPGAMNDSTDGKIRQQRFVRGDVNFDGRVDRADLDLATMMRGAFPDEQIADESSPRGRRFRWQGASLQQLLAITMTQNGSPDRRAGVSAQAIASVESMIGSRGGVDQD